MVTRAQFRQRVDHQVHRYQRLKYLRDVCDQEQHKIYSGSVL